MTQEEQMIKRLSDVEKERRTSFRSPKTSGEQKNLSPIERRETKTKGARKREIDE
jgi:hypothetical protein